MKRQNNLEQNNQQPQLEDLTVNETQAVEVKGGPTRRPVGVGADIIVFDIVDS